jgi:DNA-binding transcriptional LysR family regulator
VGFAEVVGAAVFPELNYTQPAVSKIIASLEREVGAVLVDRETRPTRLTDAGEALARHADEVFERLLTAQAEVQAIAQLDSGTLSARTFSSVRCSKGRA